MDDSALSFNPDQETQRSATAQAQTKIVSAAVTKPAPMTKKELSQLKDLNERLADQTMRVTEIETEYEHYRTRTQTEIIELRDKLDTMKEKLDSQPNYESILNNMKEAQYNLAEKENEIERVKQDYRQ